MRWSNDYESARQAYQGIYRRAGRWYYNGHARFNFFYVLHFGDERLLDFAAEIIFGHRASSIEQAIVAKGAQLLFASILGVIFAYLITRIKSINSLALHKKSFYSFNSKPTTKSMP